MALPVSGQITLNQVNVELGLSGTAQIDMNSSVVRGLFGIASGEIEMSDGYGKSNETILTSAGNVNGQAQRQQITVSSFISAGDTLVIPSNIWVWSDNINTPALTIDIACTIRNEGRVIGKGGNGGYSNTFQPMTSGGPAVSVTAAGVTIINEANAYIAGGGGGGGYGGRSNRRDWAGAGGGAGGGLGGALYSGGALNGIGSSASPSIYGKGGGAGGGGGAYYDGSQTSGGGGGRQLPGYGGAGGAGGGGTGGAAGNVGSNGYGNYKGGGGGGGWGARGGNGQNTTGANGGAAISKTTSYTLQNSGTIYGGT